MQNPFADGSIARNNGKPSEICSKNIVLRNVAGERERNKRYAGFLFHGKTSVFKKKNNARRQARFSFDKIFYFIRVNNRKKAAFHENRGLEHDPFAIDIKTRFIFPRVKHRKLGKRR